MVEYLISRGSGIIRFTRRVMASFTEHDCAKHAAALSYYTLFSMFPLLLFLVSAASLFFPSSASRQALAGYLQGVFPYGAENLTEVLDQTWQARGSVGLVSGIGLLWGGSSIFSTLETSLSKIWDSSPRNFFSRRLLGLLAVLALVVTFVSSFVIGPFANMLLENSGFGRETLRYVMELTALTVVMMLLYRIFPNEHVHWSAAFTGAFSAAVLLIVAKFAFRVYTAVVVETSGLLYGSLTWFLTLALWVYMVGVLILFGAEFAAAFQRRQQILAKTKAEKRATLAQSKSQ
jgi:membrane protein